MVRETMEFDDMAGRVSVVYDNNEEFLDTALERALADVVKAVKRYNKVGEFTVKVKIKPINETRVTFEAAVVAKPPQPSAPACTLFVNNAGHLVADDPKQPQLPGIVAVK